MNEWQYSNQFFNEGKDHYESGGLVKDCPYNYLSVDQADEKVVQGELYRQTEWLGGFHHAYRESFHKKHQIVA